MDDVTVRPAEAGDEGAFLEMWEEFTATDSDEPGDRTMGAANWQRAGDGVLSLLVAEVEGRVVGFTLYNELPFTWSKKPICYLQDLGVREEMRGRRIGQAMIEALAEIGREKGWYRIFWMTQGHNSSAQRLYDRIAERKDYIRYDLIVSDA